MRLEWIDDILAVLDCGSLALASEKRLLTQSAFTRRVRTIEENIGSTLFDRRRKPVTLLPGVQELEPEMREISARLHELRQSLSSASENAGSPLSFMCQHALTATISAQVVRTATKSGQSSVRVRSGNQDDCLVHLLSRDVDLAIMYALQEKNVADVSKAFDVITLGVDVLIPVCVPALRSVPRGGAMPTIVYPADAFLGQVFTHQISPRLPNGVTVLPVAETALTLAMMQLVLEGLGAAWLPHTLVVDELAKGTIVRLDNELPSQGLDITMLRLKDVSSSQHKDQIWHDLVASLQFSNSAE